MTNNKKRSCLHVVAHDYNGDAVPFLLCSKHVKREKRGLCYGSTMFPRGETKKIFLHFQAVTKPPFVTLYG